MGNVRIVDPQEMAAARAAGLDDPAALLARCAEEIAPAELIDAGQSDAGCALPTY